MLLCSHGSGSYCLLNDDHLLLLPLLQGFTRFVEIGRVALINYGPDEGKLCTIIDVVDGNKVRCGWFALLQRLVPAAICYHDALPRCVAVRLLCGAQLDKQQGTTYLMLP